MANTKVLILLAVLFFALELDVFGGQPFAAKEGDGIDCGSACDYRCSKASRRNICLRACNTCCDRCHCVPPGTSGNKDVCPCYANMTTHGGKPKCP